MYLNPIQLCVHVSVYGCFVVYCLLLVEVSPVEECSRRRYVCVPRSLLLVLCGGVSEKIPHHHRHSVHTSYCGENEGLFVSYNICSSYVIDSLYYVTGTGICPCIGVAMYVNISGSIAVYLQYTIWMISTYTIDTLYYVV